MDISAVIKKPKITEKSLKEAVSGWYTFLVEKKATKPQIKKAVENQFSVNVVGIKTTTIKGKSRRSGKKRLKKITQSQKKAMVSLARGQKIDLFEVGGKDEPEKT